MASRRRTLVALGLLLLGSNCGNSPNTVIGKWVSEKTSFATLEFYPDGTAALSSTGFFNLRWQLIDSKIVRIEALERKLIFNFRVQDDSRGKFGTLELAGFDTLTFRKISR